MCSTLRAPTAVLQSPSYIASGRRIRFGRGFENSQQDKKLHLKVHVCSVCRRPTTAGLRDIEGPTRRTALWGRPSSSVSQGQEPHSLQGQRTMSRQPLLLQAQRNTTRQHIELSRSRDCLLRSSVKEGHSKTPGRRTSWRGEQT